MEQKQIFVSILTIAISSLFLSDNRLRRLLLCKLSLVHLQIICFFRGTKESSEKFQHIDGKDPQPYVSAIYIYPVKSLRAVSLQSCQLSSFGLKNDRCLMVVKPRLVPPSRSNPSSHRFITQRQAPSLATINASIPTIPSEEEVGLYISLSHRGNENECSRISKEKQQPIRIDVSDNALRRYSKERKYLVGIWDDVVEVADVGDEAAEFVQAILEKDSLANGNFQDVRVVTIIPSTERELDKRYLPYAAFHDLGTVPRISLSDGFPILIASQKSLEELNRRLLKKGKDVLPMSRFRPNIVISGIIEPFDEDHWKAVRIGDCLFHVVKGCPRCKQSCTDQNTGKCSEEPLVTLREFRALGSSKTDVYFAQNAVANNASCGKEIRVGDSVRVITRGKPVWDMDAVKAQ
mmetsp:Transcript_35089/g.35299  ORF Transcript_35089/g.35299 Transcript_35089/m.35299 type:complete len:406 (-) Transcript_35089:214-1431(-)